MINSRVEEGSLSVFEDGSEASDTIMIKARTKVEKRGTLKRTQMTGGSLDIKERGLAEAIVVNGGGRMSNYSGTDIGTVVNSGTYTLGDAHSTTAQSNNLTLESGATAYIRDGILNGATLNGGLMILVDDGLSSTLKGNVTVGERGQLNVINNGHLDTHNANLNLSGRVRLKNDADFGTLLMNNGHFYFDSDSNADSKLSVETLSGSGTFWMNTDIAGHKGDFLHVRGEANGHFGVRVTDTGESPKAEDSLKIIQTGGGEAKFTLANQGQVVDVGTYQYHLVPDDLKRGWSLVSHQPQPSEKPKSPTEAPVPPPSVTETVAASRPISETEETEPKPAVPPPSVMETVAASAPDIPSITPSTAAVLSMSTVGPVMYHSEMAQIQERMSSTRQAKTESAVWVKLMNERHNIIQKAGEGYGLKLNGISLGADRTLRLGRSAYTTQGLFFTHSDAKLNFRGKAIGVGT
nr:autotransporter outer membrane beta-barrel domain-containing protein [Candidatus Hamiltonella defensa]